MKRFLIYSAAVCLISWAAFGMAYVFLGDALKSGGGLLQAVSAAYMFLPMAVALLMQLAVGEKTSSTGLVNMRISRAWLLAPAVPFALLVLTVLFSGLMPGATIHYGPEGLLETFGLEGEAAEAVIARISGTAAWKMITLTAVSGVAAGCTVNAVAALGEEYGWRNYMLHSLRGQSFLKTALLTGLVWGLWHAPIILMGHNYPQHPVAGVAMMCVFCILMGIPELYAVLRTGSVIPAAIMHGTLNAIAGLALILVRGGNDMTAGMTGLSGSAALAAVIAAIWLYDRKHGRIMSSRIPL